MNIFEIHALNEQAPIKAIDLLQQQPSIIASELTTSELKSAITKGALWLEKGKHVQRLRRFKKLIQTGETLHFYYNKDVLAQQPKPATLIDDQHHYSIWYKPSGMLSQGSKWSDHCTITRYVQAQLNDQRQCYLVHRLDRATSGLIIIAHTKKAAQRYSEIFEQHQLTKRYQAMVIANNSQPPATVRVEQPVDGKSAISHFRLINVNKEFQQTLQQLSHCIAEYEVTIETGRKHQIRQHADYLTMPIIGDRLYNSDPAFSQVMDLQLCAVELAFTCPITQENKQYYLDTSLKLSIDEVAKVLNKLST
ncbi:RluA family pseudouridine synthase [Colwellia sp. MEBiC06753]